MITFGYSRTAATRTRIHFHIRLNKHNYKFLYRLSTVQIRLGKYLNRETTLILHETKISGLSRARVTITSILFTMNTIYVSIENRLTALFLSQPLNLNSIQTNALCKVKSFLDADTVFFETHVYKIHTN